MKRIKYILLVIAIMFTVCIVSGQDKKHYSAPNYADSMKIQMAKNTSCLKKMDTLQHRATVKMKK